MIPPSPSLSARMMNVTYLTETISVIAQKIERDDAVDLLAPGLEAVLGREDGPQRVERARPDVAEDDADRAEDDRARVSRRRTLAVWP